MSAAVLFDAIARGVEAALDNKTTPYKVGEKRPYSEERADLSSKCQRLVAMAIGEMNAAAKQSDRAAKQAGRKFVKPAGDRRPTPPPRFTEPRVAARRPARSIPVVVEEQIEVEDEGTEAQRVSPSFPAKTAAAGQHVMTGAGVELEALGRVSAKKPGSFLFKRGDGAILAILADTMMVEWPQGNGEVVEDDEEQAPPNGDAS